MNLIKEKWNNKDIKEFQEYLKGLKNEDKVDWTTSILNTSMPCLAIKTPVLKQIVKEIMKGDYLSFLDHNLAEYYENVAINGFLIQKINNFEIMKKYLYRYFDDVDCWATCDLLSFQVGNNKDQFLELSRELIKSDKIFVRRIGLVILFKFVDTDIDKVLEIVSQFKQEKEYYVNMCIAWLLCDCFIKQKDKTLDFLNNKQNSLNNFTINKFVSKCRDSYRVSKEDKEMLLKFKRK